MSLDDLTRESGEWLRGEGKDGDTVISDSNAILVYLAKRYGNDDWLPQDPAAAARVHHTRHVEFRFG